MGVVQKNKDYSLLSRQLFVVVVCFSLLQFSDSSVCQHYEYIQNDAAVPENSPVTPYENVIRINYTCPRIHDPKHHTECCSTTESRGCCPKARYFYEIDRTIATIIAISVTTLCILITIIVTICCFWSRCPLYSSCRTEFSPEIATYVSKEDNIDMDTMPREISGKKNNRFSPVTISNGNIPSGVDMEAI